MPVSGEKSQIAISETLTKGCPKSQQTKPRSFFSSRSPERFLHLQQTKSQCSDAIVTESEPDVNDLENRTSFSIAPNLRLKLANRNILTMVKKCRNLTNKERLHLFQLLLKDFNGKKLKHGSIKKQAKVFSVSTKTVSKIWKMGGSFIATSAAVDVSHKRTNNAGRKRIDIDPEKVKHLDLRRRKTLEGLAHGLGMSKTTVFRRYKEGQLRRHSNAIKPKLTEDNKRERVRFCISMLELEGVFDGSRFKVKFVDMFDHIVIDEKWFFLTKDAEHYYLTCDEDEPYRTCQSKRFITKVMFLAAVARPRFDGDGNCLFNGKIGIFPFTEKEAAKRKSKNRPAGTMETKAIVSVTKEITRSWLIDKVLPAIREKWPSSSRDSLVYILQDNARPHIHPSDEEFSEASRVGGFNIRLKCQPPNSPELNVLDLGFFRAIQSLQYAEAPKNIDELVFAVEKSFNELSPKALNRVFLTLQQVMIEVLRNKGGNNFKTPHMQKGKLEREGCLPLSLSCDFGVVEHVCSASELADTWIAKRLENLSLQDCGESTSYSTPSAPTLHTPTSLACTGDREREYTAQWSHQEARPLELHHFQLLH